MVGPENPRIETLHRRMAGNFGWRATSREIGTPMEALKARKWIRIRSAEAKLVCKFFPPKDD
jgi:hypothetical protein